MCSRAEANTLELPPRARRIRATAKTASVRAGTTSACAENTLTNRTAGNRQANYLRVRGEYWCPDWKRLASTELPPRARRIRSTSTFNLTLNGTTSACAENTGVSYTDPIYRGNYLRVRGEYFRHPGVGLDTSELPPRARRILMPSSKMGVPPGTTSACAENTAGSGTCPKEGRNYLRARGEYEGLTMETLEKMELPPRTRRIQEVHGHHAGDAGTTSAHAENT